MFWGYFEDVVESGRVDDFSWRGAKGGFVDLERGVWRFRMLGSL